MRRFLHYLLAIVLFGVFFASYSDLLSHVLYYNEQHQLFLYTADYYHSQTLTGWLTAFVVQFFHYPMLGAAVMSALLTAISLMTWRIFTALSRREDILCLSLIPSLALWVWTAGLSHTLSVVVWAFIVLVMLFVPACLLAKGKTIKQFPLAGWKYAVAVVVSVAVISLASGYSFLRSFSMSEFRMIKAQQAIDRHDWDDALHHTERYLDNQKQPNPLIFYFHQIQRHIQQLNAVTEKLTPLINELRSKGISVKYDDAENKRPGFKFADYELKGVPVRLVLGARDLEEGTIEVMRRDTLEKESRPIEGIAAYVENLLDEIQDNIFKKALDFRNAHIYECDNYEEFKERVKDGGFFLCHWDGTAETEAKIKEDTQATIRCVPFMFEQTPGVDMVSGKPATQRVIIARSY